MASTPDERIYAPQQSIHAAMQYFHTNIGVNDDRLPGGLFPRRASGWQE
jgi:hypothetical protein